MSKVINLTPHSIEVYPEAAFKNLEQTNPTTWIADSVDQNLLLESFASQGVARITTSVVPAGSIGTIPAVQTSYGELTGIPVDVDPFDVLIVSLPTQSMAIASGNPLAKNMVSPYKVVRLRSNTSTVLGCMGLSYQ